MQQELEGEILANLINRAVEEVMKNLPGTPSKRKKLHDEAQLIFCKTIQDFYGMGCKPEMVNEGMTHRMLLIVGERKIPIKFSIEVRLQKATDDLQLIKSISIGPPEKHYNLPISVIAEKRTREYDAAMEIANKILTPLIDAIKNEINKMAGNIEKGQIIALNIDYRRHQRSYLDHLMLLYNYYLSKRKVYIEHWETGTSLNTDFLFNKDFLGGLL